MVVSGCGARDNQPCTLSQYPPSPAATTTTAADNIHAPRDRDGVVACGRFETGGAFDVLLVAVACTLAASGIGSSTGILGGSILTVSTGTGSRWMTAGPAA